MQVNVAAAVYLAAMQQQGLPCLGMQWPLQV
jgi:hypothetical protein